MSNLSARTLQRVLADLAGRYDVPGASLAVLDDGELAEAVTGVTSKDTAVTVTSETVFQIGSITKLYTATLVMQLVDEGRIDLDAPVQGYLPELVLADSVAAEMITVRQLLSHTAGLDEDDHLPDTGRGDDCLEAYVALCRTLPQLSAPGTLFSYSSSGYVILGRLVERLTGQGWDGALASRLLVPLGAQRSVTLPEQAILHRAGVGHRRGDSGEHVPVEVWALNRSHGPAGLIASTPAEVLCFARLHLEEGVAGDGRRLLSAQAVREMQRRQVELPDKGLGTAWGLGWTHYGPRGHDPVIGHDGGTIGQLAFLRVVPEARFAFCLLTNAFAGAAIFGELVTGPFSDRLASDHSAEPLPAESRQVDLARYAGTYERLSVRTLVSVRDGKLIAEVQNGLQEGEGTPLTARDDGTFVDADGRIRIAFVDFDESGRPRYLVSEGRASARLPRSRPIGSEEELLTRRADGRAQ